MIIGNPISTGVSGSVYALRIITDPGANVSAVLGDQKILKTADDSGIVVFRLRKEGIWTITATDGIKTRTITVEVATKKFESITFFPSEPPSSYVLIDTYTDEQTWTAPEDGYFQIEVFGASGSGGTGFCRCDVILTDEGYEAGYIAFAGSGGGGGGYACSRIKMNRGDTVVLAPGSVGSVSRAIINSSLETYDILQVTSGINGKSSDTQYAAKGGAGGVGSGGNYANASGGTGGDGKGSYYGRVSYITIYGGAGGSAGYIGCNGGGAGATVAYDYGVHGNLNLDEQIDFAGSPGLAGFIKISRGNTNLGD